MEHAIRAPYREDNLDREHHVVDRVAAARIEREYQAAKAAYPRKEIPTPPRSSVPPLWNVKAQGDPIAGHAPLKSDTRRYAKVEIRPGAFHMVELPSKTQSPGPPQGPRTGNIGQQQGGRSRPISAPAARGRLPVSAAAASGTLPYQINTTELAPVVIKIEEAMREALRQRSAMHVKDRTVLLRAFGKVLGKRDVEIATSDKVDSQMFAEVWKSLGISLTAQYCFAIFNKYGQDTKGRMPVLNFVDLLMFGAPRQLMMENDYVQQGAYKASTPATHTGKIKYPQCKKGVWPPSDWEPRIAERSGQLPDVRLRLDFVYGYDGMQATSPNVFYMATGDVVYFAAAVGIVYNKESHSQRFFLGHDDDILCMGVHPDRRTVATGQAGKDPDVIVWDSADCTELQRLPQGYGNRGVTACCFSPDGTKLVCICTDNNHTMYIWDWKKKKLLMESNTYAGVPPSTYGVVWSKYEPDRLVTYGQNHVKFWTVSPDPDPKKTGQLTNKNASGVFVNVKTHTVLSACFLPSGVVLSGNQSGCICSWKSSRLARETPGHAMGPPSQRPDGSKMYGGVRCLVLETDKTLLSGGADGYVIKWDVSSGDLGPALQRIPLLRPDQMGKVLPPGVRGLDCFPGTRGVFVAGSSACDLWEVDDMPQVLVQGQPGDLNGLAMNPAYPHVFATVSEADTLAVFSALTRKPIRVVQLAQKGEMARSAAFSMDGQHLAVGLSGGGIKVMEFHPLVAQVAWIKDSSESIDELKYSPCGRFLAAGSHDQTIYIYDKLQGYKRVTRCLGHSSTVTHLDWSADSSVIMSNDQAYELLHFDPRTGRQVKENQRDTQWASWTGTLGFDVMGIWPTYSDGGDVNACDRSPSGKYLLTADNFGKVKLFNYPVVVQHAPSLVYRGHSSFVPNVRWAYDESYACSVGGRDRCTFQFRIIRDTASPPPTSYNFVPLDKDGIVWSDPTGAPSPGGMIRAQPAGRTPPSAGGRSRGLAVRAASGRR